MEKAVSDLWALYINTNKRYGTLQGIRYEAYAHKKILAHGVNSTANSLTTDGVGTSTKQISIPASLPKIPIPTNDLQVPFQNLVRRTRHTGGYLLPYHSNFPVVDSLYIPVNETDEILSLQMKAGRSKQLSGQSAALINATTGGCLVFVVPDEGIISKKKGYSGNGPQPWRHYRLVLNENCYHLRCRQEGW